MCDLQIVSSYFSLGFNRVIAIEKHVQQCLGGQIGVSQNYV